MAAESMEPTTRARDRQDARASSRSSSRSSWRCRSWASTSPTLSIFSGALGVGLGFGLQKIASNYVSGFIVLLDRSLRIGDVITRRRAPRRGDRDRVALHRDPRLRRRRVDHPEREAHHRQRRPPHVQQLARGRVDGRHGLVRKQRGPRLRDPRGGSRSKSRGCSPIRPRPRASSAWATAESSSSSRSGSATR